MAQTRAPETPHGGLTIGERISHVRRLRGMQRKGLAAASGISYKTIGRYERDDFEPGASSLGRLAVVLKTSTDYLVGLSDDPEVPDPDSPTRVWLNPAA